MTGTTIDHVGLRRRLAAARDQQLAARREAASALAAYERAGCPPQGSPECRTAEEAKERRRQAELSVAQIEGEQKASLVQLSNDGAGVSGVGGNGPMLDSVSGDGWQQLVEGLKPTARGIEASVPLDSLMRPPTLATTSLTPSSGLSAPAYEVEGIVPLARDTRFGLTQNLRSQQVEQGDLALAEFRQVGTRTVTGAIERDPVATSEKAKLATSIELVTPSLKQLAIIQDGVPSKLFDAVQGLGDSASPAALPGAGLLLEWLRSELQYQLNRALDAHIMAQLIAAKPAFSETGTGKITQIRNAISAHRALGAMPTVLVASPKLAAELDSLEDSNKRPVFATRDTGSASPLFGLTIVEITSEEHAPVLLDPMVIGLTYFSLGTLFINPFTKATTNQVDVRLEFDTLFHVRDVSGAYVVSKEALK
jgi:hypothetical protein